MKVLSVRLRLTAWYAAALAITFVMAGIGVWLAIRNSINTTVDKELRARVDAMRLFLETEGSGKGVGPLKEELSEEAAIAPAGTKYRVGGPDGWTYTSPGTDGWPPAAPERSAVPEEGLTETLVSKAIPYRVLTARVPAGVVQIGIPTWEFQRMLDHFTWTALFAAPLALIVASAGGYWLAGRALAPINEIARTAADIEARNLSRRLPLVGTGDELDRLSATLNSMLARLQSAFQRMAQFTADASHELRTPVAIIRTTAEVSRAKPRSQEEYERALDRIRSESECMTDLIQDLMLLARADSGADGLERGRVAFSELVCRTCSDMRVLAEYSGLHLESNVAPGCEVLGDEAALHRALIVLLDNAIKFTPRDGRIDVTLELLRTERKPLAQVRVRDTGIGIPAEDLPHVFDRFYRAAKDRSRRTGGAGLGLSIARTIAAGHGGEVVVESKPGAGSVFSLRIPAV